MLESAKATVEILVSVTTLGAILAAGWWFLYTDQIKPRLQFDLDCRIIPTSGEARLVEIQCIVENKGFVEHRLYKLTVSVHGTGRDAAQMSSPSPSAIFPIRLLRRTSIVPEHTGYYFVRPGVRQVFTRIIAIPSTVSAIRVTAGFLYDREKSPPNVDGESEYPHTARRIFAVAPAGVAHEA